MSFWDLFRKKESGKQNPAADSGAVFVPPASDSDTSNTDSGAGSSGSDGGGSSGGDGGGGS